MNITFEYILLNHSIYHAGGYLELVAYFSNLLNAGVFCVHPCLSVGL